MWQLLSQKT